MIASTHRVGAFSLVAGNVEYVNHDIFINHQSIG